MARKKVEKKEEIVATPSWRPSFAPPASLRAAQDEEKLDPQEEKILDWILKGVVIFVLGWLALGVFLAIGGYFGWWK